MPQFTVPLIVKTVAHGTVEVEAESQIAARQLVQDEIASRGWDSSAWQDGHFEVSWQESEELSVDDELIDGEIHTFS